MKTIKQHKIKTILISVSLSLILTISGVIAPRTAQALISPHIVIAWMGGYTARIWSADPQNQWKYLWMRNTDRYARNCDGIPVANFEVYTENYSNDMSPNIDTYSNFQYTVTADLVPDYANTPIKIFIDYYDGELDIIYGTLDSWACIPFVLNKPALITICRYLPEWQPHERHIRNIGYLSPKTGIY